MKTKALAILLIIVLNFSSFVTTPVRAAAYGTSFTTSITYMNVSTSPATIVIDFYPEAGGTPINIPMPTLNAGAGTSVYVGSLSQLGQQFKGSAVLSSDQPIIATLVQIAPGSSGIKNRPLSNGFSAGSSYVLIPTVLRNVASTNSIFSVQNADSVGADLTINFVPVSGSIIQKTVTNLPPGAAKYYDLGQMPELGSSFNGSVQIFSKKTGTSTGGSVVATSMELSITGNGVYAFEGTFESGNVVFMPSAFCKYGAGGAINSFYAVQNTSTSSSASVTVVYSSGKSDGPYIIDPGKKQSFPGCGVSGNLNSSGFIGSATINSVGGEIVAVGKIVGAGLTTAFLGFTDGASKVALPYVRWTELNWLNGTRQRAFIAIQNVGSSELPAGSVTIKYYDKNGVLRGTHTINSAIQVGGKVNSNPIMVPVPLTEFGYEGGQIGGGAIVEGPAGSKLAVVVRIQTYNPADGTSVGEDYNGIPIP